MGELRSSLLEIRWAFATQTYTHGWKEVCLCNLRSTIHEIWSLIKACETSQQRQIKRQSQQPNFIINLIICRHNNHFNITATSYTEIYRSKSDIIVTASSALLKCKHAIYLISSLNLKSAFGSHLLNSRHFIFYINYLNGSWDELKSLKANADGKKERNKKFNESYKAQATNLTRCWFFG